METEQMARHLATLAAFIRPMFRSQHSHQGAHNHLSLKNQRILLSLLAFLGTRIHVTESCRNTHSSNIINIVNINNK